MKSFFSFEKVEPMFGSGRRDLDSSVTSVARTEISPFWVRKTTPLTPTISPTSSLRHWAKASAPSSSTLR